MRKAKQALLIDALRLCITRPSMINDDKSISGEVAALRRLAVINSIVETALAIAAPTNLVV